MRSLYDKMVISIYFPSYVFECDNIGMLTRDYYVQSHSSETLHGKYPGWNLDGWAHEMMFDERETVVYLLVLHLTICMLPYCNNSNIIVFYHVWIWSQIWWNTNVHLLIVSALYQPTPCKEWFASCCNYASVCSHTMNLPWLDDDWFMIVCQGNISADHNVQWFSYYVYETIRGFDH